MSFAELYFVRVLTHTVPGLLIRVLIHTSLLWSIGVSTHTAARSLVRVSTHTVVSSPIHVFFCNDGCIAILMRGRKRESFSIQARAAPCMCARTQVCDALYMCGRTPACPLGTWCCTVLICRPDVSPVCGRKDAMTFVTGVVGGATGLNNSSDSFGVFNRYNILNGSCRPAGSALRNITAGHSDCCPQR
uniref:Secreted protein n=1 Tax=Trichogramma kaykai TaxID=54128 RepID=A0ABD2WMC9_9HYME